jgi:glycosyltransferase involved in cell wall biosynthesis
VEDLTKQIIVMLKHPDRVHKIGQKARAHIAKHYDWKDIAQRTDFLYELIQLDPIIEDARA